MTLHYNTISPNLLSTLRKFMQDETFKEFRLVGGTALALQLGHRISVDIDLFTDREYGTMDLSSITHFFKKNFTIADGLDTLTTTAPGYTIYCGDNKDNLVKVDLYYTDSFLYPPVIDDNLRISDIRDIAAMKILAISNSTRGKDFWDIHELMNTFALDDIINFGLQRFPYGLDRDNVISILSNIPVESIEPSINSLNGDYWEFVAEDIIEEATKLLTQQHCHKIE